MLKLQILLVTLLMVVSSAAQTIDISLLNTSELNSVTISIRQGRYRLKKGNETLGEYKKNAIFYVSRFGNSLQVRDKKNFIGNFKEIELAATDDEGILSIKPVNPVMDGANYDDNLIVRLDNNKMRLINRIAMEKYISAVIEAEGGNNAGVEYYKTQAVLIRTFTIKNLLKHAEEGFNLCDQVHCQAYKARSSQNQLIHTATIETAGMVVIDTDSVLIMSPFHSNCGGETSSSGLYWQKDLPYLESVKDPFCTHASHATWEVTIRRSQWLEFINQIKENSIDYSRQDFSFNIPHRTKFVSIHGLEINLRQVREQFALKSSYFSIDDRGDELIIKGRGYGHGIGMCQQGAIEMANVGYSWTDILHFYFHNISVADYREMELHRFQPE